MDLMGGGGGGGAAKNNSQAVVEGKRQKSQEYFFKGACHSKHQMEGNVLFVINLNGAHCTKMTIVL